MHGQVSGVGLKKISVGIHSKDSSAGLRKVIVCTRPSDYWWWS